MNKRVDGLNFIRILDMTMILLFHAKLIYGFHTGIPWMNRLVSVGAVFITVFFMLSGFGLRKSNGGLSIRDFSDVLSYYKKRILSIYPLFFLLSVVALIFQFRVADSFTETLTLLPIQFSMLHILFGKDMHWFLFNDNCWYISALFVLYLLFPFLNSFVNWISNRFGVLAKIGLCFVLWIVSVSVYFYLVYCTEYVFLDYYPNPFLRIPEFMIGMMCADLADTLGQNRVNSISKIRSFLNARNGLGYGVILVVLALVASVCLLALYPPFKWETNLYNVLVIPCTAVCFLVIANWEWLNRVGRTKIVRWMAGLGLEVYLCQSFATLVLEYVKVDGKWDEVVFIVLTVIFAIGVNMLFSRPIKKLSKE